MEPRNKVVTLTQLDRMCGEHPGDISWVMEEITNAGFASKRFLTLWGVGWEVYGGAPSTREEFEELVAAARAARRLKQDHPSWHARNPGEDDASFRRRINAAMGNDA